MSGILDYVLGRLIILPGIIIGLSVHEFGHAFVSDRCGDPTPRQQGRLSLNPLAHIDVVGFISLLLLGFGWGKPVQIDPRWYKHRRRDEIMVAAAGVCMNLIIAFIGAAVMGLMYHFCNGLFSIPAWVIVFRMLAGLVQINIVLIFFNLIPLPPLDGFGIITQLFGLDRRSWYYRFYQLGPMILILLIIADVTQFILMPPVNWLYNILINLFM